jgi:hypothetical protein
MARSEKSNPVRGGASGGVVISKRLTRSGSGAGHSVHARRPAATRVAATVAAIGIRVPRAAGRPASGHAPPAHSLAVITWGELGLPGLCLFGLLWLRWFQVGASFLRDRLNPDAMHRLGIGFLFGAMGMFIQSITEWTYRQTSLMFTLHVMMGALASLYYAKRVAREKVEERDESWDEIEVEATPVAVSAVRAPR